MDKTTLAKRFRRLAKRRMSLEEFEAFAATKQVRGITLLDNPPGAGAQLVMDAFEEAILRIQRRSALTVAASDAPERVKESSDYVCTGTNDHEQIQQAIDALPAGGMVLLSRGTFHALSIYGDDNVTLAGEGYATVVRLPNNATPDSISGLPTNFSLHRVFIATKQPGRVARFVLRDLTVDGNGANQTPAANEHWDNILFYRCDECEAINVSSIDCIQNNGSGTSNRASCILMTDATRCRVRGGSYENSGYECIGFRQEAIDCSVTEAIARHGRTHGIAMQPGSIRCGAFHCIVDEENAADIGKGIVCHGTKDARIIGNTVRAEERGIDFLDGAERITVTGNYFSSKQNATVAVRNGTRDVEIDANICVCTAPLTVTDGKCVHVRQDASRIAITNNWIWSENGEGVQVRDTGQHQTVADNIVIAPSHTGIQIRDVSHFSVTGNLVQCHPSASNRRTVLISNGASSGVVDGNVAMDGNTQGIRVNSDCADVAIVANDVTGCVSEPLAIQAGAARITVSNNPGAINESRGAATVLESATSVTVNHGLAFTPAVGDVQATPAEDIDGRTFWVNNYTATTFDVQLSAAAPAGGLQFAWHARVHG